ncbi:hypothetical protein GA0115252_109223, partial [Streptomyces sp. DfronAA-171]
ATLAEGYRPPHLAKSHRPLPRQAAPPPQYR